MRITTLTLLTAALLAATVSQAAATLPAFKTNLVVVGKSIGGAKLGASKASVQKSWGKSCTRSGPQSCSYNAKGDTQGIKGTGTVSYSANGKLFGVSITAPSKNPFRAPFTKLRTAKGIGIGSTRKQLTSAYPAGRSSNQGLYYVLGSGGPVETEFTLGSDERVVAIQIRSVSGN